MSKSPSRVTHTKINLPPPPPTLKFNTQGQWRGDLEMDLNYHFPNTLGDVQRSYDRGREGGGESAKLIKREKAPQNVSPFSCFNYLKLLLYM